jgi:cyclopropane-fatty-acyl-phospholipid synthase
MTYSCAVFERRDVPLVQAQSAKHELVCDKLALRPGSRLLDIGCGWGSVLIHAVGSREVEAGGVTVSAHQAELAVERVAEAGLSDRVEIRLRDYRNIDDGPVDAISSIRMFEHVGRSPMQNYVQAVVRGPR